MIDSWSIMHYVTTRWSWWQRTEWRDFPRSVNLASLFAVKTFAPSLLQGPLYRSTGASSHNRGCSTVHNTCVRAEAAPAAWTDAIPVSFSHITGPWELRNLQYRTILREPCMHRTRVIISSKKCLIRTHTSFPNTQIDHKCCHLLRNLDVYTFWGSHLLIPIPRYIMWLDAWFHESPIPHV